MSKLSDLLQRHRNRWRDAENPTHRLSQEELSSELGYGESTYGQWERARSQPQDRRDMVRLIEILQKGNGIETLNEANNLLQAAGYYELAPHEIRQIKPAWLPRGKGESENGEERSTAERSNLSLVMSISVFQPTSSANILSRDAKFASSTPGFPISITLSIC